MRYKYPALAIFMIFVFTGAVWAQKPNGCRITSDTTPPAVNAGSTHQFTASCLNPTWSVSGPGSINPSTGVYTAPATVWARDVSRGVQLLPDNSVYKLPINNCRSIPVRPIGYSELPTISQAMRLITLSNWSGPGY